MEEPRTANVAPANVSGPQLNVGVAVKEKSLLLVRVVGNQGDPGQRLAAKLEAGQVNVVFAKGFLEQPAQGIVAHFADETRACSESRQCDGNISRRPSWSNAQGARLAESKARWFGNQIDEQLAEAKDGWGLLIVDCRLPIWLWKFPIADCRLASWHSC